MKCNVGKVDKAIRVVVGVALIAYAANGGPLWAWIGVVPLITAVIGFCPAYTLLKKSTCCSEKSCCDK